MMICMECYKKLRYGLFSPFDYTGTGDGLKSTCCEAEVKEIDGRRYHGTVKKLKEQKRLDEWRKMAAL